MGIYQINHADISAYTNVKYKFENYYFNRYHQLIICYTVTELTKQLIL